MKALVIDDDLIFIETVAELMEVLNFETIAIRNPVDALKYTKEELPDIILCDLSMPQMNGLDLFKKAKELHPKAIFIVMTGYASVESAVEAMRMGASDYLQKPFSLEHLDLVVKRAVNERNLKRENQELKVKLGNQVSKHYKFHDIIGKSPSMRKIFAQIEKVAPTNANILISGESGTGKEMIARAIHAYSKRQEEKFIGVDCCAIPSHLLPSELFGYEKGAFTGADRQRPGLFEEGERGTFFMDEITEIDYDMQAKLLRAIQERQFRRVGGRDLISMDVRLLAATKRNPLQAVQDNIFREDLYYRLNTIPIELPALRNRKEDIPLLIQHFIKSSSYLTASDESIQIESDAVNALIHYDWPGNIRELRNIVERMCILSSNNCIKIDDIPQEIINTDSSFSMESSWLNEMNYKDAKNQWLKTFEKEYITNALENVNGNISRAAEKSGINRRTFHRLLQKYKVTSKA